MQIVGYYTFTTEGYENLLNLCVTILKTRDVLPMAVQCCAIVADGEHKHISIYMADSQLIDLKTQFYDVE